MASRAILLLVSLFSIAVASGNEYPYLIVERPAFDKRAPVHWKTLWRKELHGIIPPAAAKLQPLFDYEFATPEVALRASLGYVGLPSRLRKFLEKLLAGVEPLKIGVIGGSISAGATASKIGVTDWFSIVSTYLANVTTSPVIRRNGCVHATSSAYMVFCLENYVDPDVNLLFVEYSFNDGFEDKIRDNSLVMMKEQLARRLLKLPSKPAVVFVQVPHVWKDHVNPYFITMEDLEGAITTYYDIPTASTRASLFRLNVHNPTDGFHWNQVYLEHHPIDAGHKLMADSVIHLIQEVAIGLFTVPLSEKENAWQELPFPPPIHADNYEPTVPTCLSGDMLTPMFISSQGFNWVNEGTEQKPKWGYVGTIPGNEITMRLATPNDEAKAAFVAAKRNTGNHTFTVIVQYLTSYVLMGKAFTDCVGGCRCGFKIDGHRNVSRSVTSLIPLSVQWADMSKPCDIRFTIMNETNSGAHKFKVNGFVILATADSLPTRFGLHNFHP